ncbi:outer membrane protein, multidrug efflux system [Oryzomicrobium terrae]|uniref:Outer membrane protein, multidrug efflux system n=1 Tax=Oryzomicrobium terrae TaxID=1735038 RepID=A0A5C1EAI4_9RHOO|nr:efflux transporter outer membrane subunit [Oryzomicrobium terrae]QEL65177.1 outer membrane protein, multidrug efflux system [Oryzomicrobium terrae]
MTKRFNSSRGLPLLLASLLVLAGCSLAPTYERPLLDTPAAFKEAQEAVGDDSPWKPAQPAEAQPRGDWWTIFADDTLNALENQALAANQDLKAAAARLAQARALEQNARSGLFPQVGVGFGPTRQRPSPASQGLAADADTTPSTLWRAQGTVAYEADLFGRVRSGADAAGADALQQRALFQSVLLALQADVAQAYFLVRELDATAALYSETVELRGQTLRLFQRRFDEGDISELDLARARTELAAAQSEALGVARQRAVAEHALAILLGQAPAAFSLPPQPLARLTVRIPAGLPSALLERRPDIAAAEYAMAAANARIGAARAAYFPRLNLTGAFGYGSADLGDLFKWSSRSFLLGPLVGTALSLPLLDGGARRAGVDFANAKHEEEVANYRQAVLKAFKEVEDNLAGLRLLDAQNQAQDDAVSAARRAARLSHIQYREGSVSYLSVIDADRSVLQQQRVAVSLDGERARATVGLIRALGGSWGEAAAPVAGVSEPVAPVGQAAASAGVAPSAVSSATAQAGVAAGPVATAAK